MLARELLSGYPHVYVYDVKGDFNVGEFDRIITTPQAFGNLDINDRAPVIYRPNAQYYGNMVANEAICKWIYDRKDCTFYVDELSSILSPAGTPPPHFQFILTRGRAMNIRCISCTQRPSRIPLSILTESEHVAMFRLGLREDRKRISEVVESDAVLPIPSGHTFYYCHDGKIHLCNVDKIS